MRLLITFRTSPPQRASFHKARLTSIKSSIPLNNRDEFTKKVLILPRENAISIKNTGRDPNKSAS